MGAEYVYRCPKCDHEEELLSGVGFMSPVEADMERERYTLPSLPGTPEENRCYGRCSVGLKVNFQGKNCVAFVLLIPPKTGQFQQTLKY
mgnify:CR=1 FL=1